jgi:hypothetical protein
MKNGNHRFAIRLIALFATLFWSGSAIAVDSYLTSFQNQYPTSTTGTTAWSSSSGRCNVCHSSGGGSDLNGYGAAWAMRHNAGRTVTQAFVDIEGDNSDGSSVNNISEITANAQPGWSPGATNTLYDLSGTTAVLFNQNPPTTLIGDADPAATPTPTPTPTPPPTVLANISTRLDVETGDNVLIGGFIVTGTQPKKVIVRAIGPSLNVNGVPLPDRLANPTLDLNGPGGLIASNDDWRDDPAQEAEIIASGVPPIDDLESAIVATLPANSAYTAVMRGVNNTTGIGAVEAYDLDPTVDSQLANISTRGLVQTGDNVMIGGIIAMGTGSQKVIVRAIGPSLANAVPPVMGALADPTLELYDGNGMLLLMNDNWRDDPAQEAEIIASGVPPTDDMESAIVAILPASNTGVGYTAIVRGANGTTGVALVEFYALAP